MATQLGTVAKLPNGQVQLIKGNQAPPAGSTTAPVFAKSGSLLAALHAIGATSGQIEHTLAYAIDHGFVQALGVNAPLVVPLPGPAPELAAPEVGAGAEGAGGAAAGGAAAGGGVGGAASKVGQALKGNAGKVAEALTVGALFTNIGLWKGLGLVLAGAVLILIGILNLAGVDPSSTARRVVRV